MKDQASPVRDAAVVGASAGGIQALGDLVSGLPSDLPAAVFVVVHFSRDILSRGALPGLAAVSATIDPAPEPGDLPAGSSNE